MAYPLNKITKNEGVWVALGQLVSVAMSFVGIKIFTNYLNPIAYGEIAICLTLAALLNQTIFSPMSSGLSRFYPLAINGATLNELLAEVQRIIFIAALGVVMLGAVAAMLLLILGYASWSGLIGLATIFSILSGIYSINIAYLNSARLRSISALYQGLEPFARYSVSALLIIGLSDSSSMALFGFIVALVIILTIQYCYYSGGKNFLYSSEKENRWKKYFWEYIWPISISGITSWTFMSSQIWALHLFGEPGDVGYYSVLIQLGFTPFTMIGSFATTLMMPVIFETVGDGSNADKVRRVYVKIVKSSVCFVVGIIFLSIISVPLHSYILKIFTSESYAKYSNLLPAAILAGGLLQTSIFLSTIPMIFVNTKIFLPLNTYGNIIIALSNLFFAHQYGIYGLFFSMVLGSLFHLCWNIYNIFKIKSLRISWMR